MNMMENNQKGSLRIALICNNVVRELGTLKVLKKELERQIGAEVRIIGSLAEIQRTFFSLFKFKPHIVFLSQLQERCCRDIASYVEESGGMVIVMPEEITPAKVVESLVLNPDFTYDHLVDLVCLPGQVMYDFFVKTDIKKDKIKITGSPKIDIELQQTGMSRKEFVEKFPIQKERKNVFFFTSFPHTGMEYFKTDECFKGHLDLISDIQTVIKDTQKVYLKHLPTICKKLSEYNVILKPHPLEELHYYKELKADNLTIITGISVLDCMDSIDVAVHWNSTVSTSCWFHQVPTLQYSPIKKHNWLLSRFTTGNPLLHDHEELIKSLKTYLKEKKSLPKKYLEAQQKYFQDNFYKTDGKSSERIAKLVKKTAKQKKFELHYRSTFNPVWYAIAAVEKILGVSTSRRLINFASNAYNWRYAAENYLP